MKMSHEGFGRQILSAGVSSASTSSWDVHRFGFEETLEKLAAEGTRYVDAEIKMIRKFPEVANS